MGLDMSLTADGVEIGYWRKANAIHTWFVKHVQNGVNECAEHPVSKEQLTTLRDTCQRVLVSCKLVPGQVYAGSYAGPETNGKWVKRYEPGYIVEDPSLAIELLPTQSGFFFGGTDYDEWYVKQLIETIKFCNVALERTNITYQSSW